MVAFKTALEALAKDELTLDKVSDQLAKLLRQSPRNATFMLDDLDRMYDQKKIDDAIHAKLKRQINQYRRSHPLETESNDFSSSSSTVFAKDGSFAVKEPSSVAIDNPDKPATETATPSFDVANSLDKNPIDSDFSGTMRESAATGPISTNWSDLSGTSQQTDVEMGPGSVIKLRFKLLKVLGVGGMGKVYKGIDLLKEEARDKNPYVAIKLLNEDFRNHPEAFISLQRESSRQQKLAHPNIATVYDFDRIGGTGTAVYITMELLEGIALNDYIKKHVRKAGGLPFEEAFQIIRQLGAALSYAHERGLVHSDFKPGNAFLCKDGTVKTLDFGIARAVKNPVTGESDKTLFDPGKLGALTPAYASLEMLEGEEPDTRDDTYALGCVAYELLAGKHPFNKLPANKAMENRLVPANVKGLKKKQNKALQKALAFRRKDRFEDVNEFIEALEAKFIWYKSPLAIAAVLVIVIGIGVTAPVLNYMHDQTIRQIMTDIKSGDSEVIRDRLAAISEFEKTDQLSITNEAKESIQHYFKDEITRLIDISNDNYNFPEAEKLLDKVALYFPDSSFLLTQKDRIATNKKQELSHLYSQFSGALSQAEEQNDASLLDNTKTILETIRLQIDPDNALLTDPRPSNQYRILADEQVNLNNFDHALSLVSSGLYIAPQDQQLLDLKNRIEKQIKIVDLQEQLSNNQNQFASLSDYKQHEEEIQKLAELNPGDPLLSSLAVGLKEQIEQELARIMENGNRADAEALTETFNNLLSALELSRLSTQIKLAQLSGTERTTAVQSIVENDKAAIRELLANPQLDNEEWKTKGLAIIQELDSLSGEDSTIAPALQNMRRTISDLYITEASQTLAANRFDAAEGLVDSAERFAPELAVVNNFRNKLLEARAKHNRQLRIDGLKEDFIAQIEGNQVVKALDYFRELKTESPAEDNFILTEAPAMIAESYGALAKSRYAAADYANAVKLIDEGLRYNSADTALQSLRREYTVDNNIDYLSSRFESELTFNSDDIRTKFGEIESVAPAKYSKFRQDTIKLLEKRIRNISNKNDAATLARSAATIFPGTILDRLKQELKPEPWQTAPLARAALNAGKLTTATTMQQSDATEFAGHPEFLAFSKELNLKKAGADEAYQLYLKEKATSAEDYEALRNAKKLLLRAQALWTDNPDYDRAESELDRLIATNKPAPRIIQRETVNIEEAITETGIDTTNGSTKKEWRPVSSGRECESKLAGYGKRARAICYDFVNDGWRGPLMVVVPVGGEFKNNFAISKYEISVGDYSKYCALTGRCKPVTNKERFDEPQTNISFSEVEAYSAWLSERTGKSYRVPTVAEWEYAAIADGKQPIKDFNCRVALGDKIIKGTGPVNVKSGQSNGWGLKNTIGNVQEWTLDGNTLKARGGAFEDAHSKCEISMERQHNGLGDNATGFRLVLEDAG